MRLEKDIAVASMRLEKDIAVNAMRCERDVSNKLFELTYTEELKTYRDSLAAKRQALAELAETPRANE